MRQISASVERERLKMNAGAVAEESAERAAFRATLMADISNLRAMVKDCEADRDTQRTRLNTAEEQILILKASNEIMEKWLAFFKDRNAMEMHAAAASASTGSSQRS